MTVGQGGLRVEPAMTDGRGTYGGTRLPPLQNKKKFFLKSSSKIASSIVL